MIKTVIDSESRKVFPDFRELSKYRDLFLILAYRDFRVRYAQTFLGLVWVFIQPLFILFILNFVFGRAINIDTGGIPYPVFALSGMMAWTYFSFLMSQAGQSIINNGEMIKKIYFPRLVVPLSKGLVGLIDYFMIFIFFMGMMLIYQVSPSSNIVYLPVFVLLVIFAASGIGIWLSALTIRYRDLQQVVPFLVQIGLYITPVAYPSSFVINNLPGWAQQLYFFNPVAGIIEGIRWSVFGTPLIMERLWISVAISAVLFITSLIYFRKMELVMADLI
ncbi:MAG TPA: phosphate ABC transporter permease [Cytophagales bacterium]|nr:phosphate ABC transporter permease [Cytophagales bacterium]HAA18632.1 phosphate ABC transporter permease [Cytophagales bacterium]HAP64572.1 phosphate ABC transporter permease [Cytophagales bacterium]